MSRGTRSIALLVLALVIVAVSWFYYDHDRVQISEVPRDIPEIGAMVAGFATPPVYYGVYGPYPYITIVASGRADPDKIRAFCGSFLQASETPGTGAQQRHTLPDIAAFTTDSRIARDFGASDLTASGDYEGANVELHYRSDERVFTVIAQRRR